jgi:hypothetical protein
LPKEKGQSGKTTYCIIPEWDILEKLKSRGTMKRFAVARG